MNQGESTEKRLASPERRPARPKGQTSDVPGKGGEKKRGRDKIIPKQNKNKTRKDNLKERRAKLVRRRQNPGAPR